MLDKWLNDDINNLFNNGSTIVLIDESGEMKNILTKLNLNCKVYEVNSPLEELKARYEIEKCYGEQNLIYTNTKYNKLKFVLEYASINGYIDIYSLADYVKNKLYNNYKIVINNLMPEEYKSAAIYSIGKDISYWHNIQTVGAEGILDIKRSSLDFLNNPDKYLKSLDETSVEAFSRKIFELLGLEYMKKPATTIAKELSTAIFDNLLYSKENKTLKEIYNAWIDSKEYEKSFKAYLSDYRINNEADIWKCDYIHPFEVIDKKIIEEFTKNLHDREFKSNHSAYINKRITMMHKLPFDISYYNYLKILINFDTNSISKISNLNSAISFYTENMSILDDAVRKLLKYFSNDKTVVQNIEEFYKEQINIYLDKWFLYFDEYKQNQTGILQKIIDNNAGNKIGVIVGDGISYSIAKNISNKLKNSAYTFNEDYIKSDFPSETENNMSQIFCEDGHVEKLQQNRRTYLSNKNPDKRISYVEIDKLSDSLAELSDVLICAAKDIDELGEKLQAKALEYFDSAEDTIADAINTLMKNGFKKVYLISDHGFVLSKILTEADKVDVDCKGNYCVSERYIVSDDKQTCSKLVELQKENKYFYFAKNMNPFKTPGKYGYSHGGLTPHELITPLFSWEKQADLNLLDVKIENKKDLSNNMGELFPIILSAKSGGNSLFSLSRKIFINFYVDGKNIKTSDVFEINANDTIKKEYSLDGNKQMQIQILDAETKELLDSTKVIKNQGRDLDGLL